MSAGLGGTGRVADDLYVLAHHETTGKPLVQPRFVAFDAAIGGRHPSEPHQYLAILAVRPDRQRRGTGTALLRAYHQVLDGAAGMAAYLEAITGHRPNCPAGRCCTR